MWYGGLNWYLRVSVNQLYLPVASLYESESRLVYQIIVLLSYGFWFFRCTQCSFNSRNDQLKVVLLRYSPTVIEELAVTNLIQLISLIFFIKCVESFFLFIFCHGRCQVVFLLLRQQMECGEQNRAKMRCVEHLTSWFPIKSKACPSFSCSCLLMVKPCVLNCLNYSISLITFSLPVSFPRISQLLKE